MAVDPTAVDKFASAFGDTQLVADFGPLSNASEDDESVVRAEESTQDGLESMGGEGGESSPDSTAPVTAGKATSKQEAKQAISGDKDSIIVTDETGRRRSVEIDYSNREEIKKIYAQAAGMRKFQAERDREIQSKKEVESRLSQREQDWNKLETAFKAGHENLFDMLNGRPGAFQALVSKEIEKREFLKYASPAELQAMKDQEAAALTKNELDTIRKENAEFKRQVQEERETAELRSMESRIHPAFEKHRFAEKLGNAQDEHLFDEMLWNSSIKRLEQYEEKGMDISPELVEREFRAVATALRNRIGAVAEKKAGQVIAQKKQEATENVQSRIKSSMAGSSDGDKLKGLIQSGNTGDIFKNWGAFKGILGGKK
jgi:ubiquitin